ncbi:hypothetical protein [Microbacterium sp. APC 3901]|uniref:hypothetical protein n=1 Tax=Microbacterium sp. APC 3901 TaxID=3035192 RepID=UPI0025B41BE3|nr:hypothetical protein [Microbacterium sp. APC 3901]MDN3444971.1 hypothetical protein [Microbacterium sp. APC 3901]
MSTESPFLNNDESDAGRSPAAPEMTVEEDFSDDDGVLYDDEVTPEYGILGFTLRELLIVGAWLIAFIASFFPYVGDASIWGAGIQWILPIGVPTVAVFLLVLRRFSPDGIRRVGSLGIDQFASVAFSVSAVFWVGALWNAVAFVIEFGVFGLPWNGVVQLLAALALVVFTVFAPLVPGLKEDFQGRLVTLAHRNANPVRPVIARPRPEPVPAASDTPEATAEDPAPHAPAASAPHLVSDPSADAGSESHLAPVTEDAAPAATAHATDALPTAHTDGSVAAPYTMESAAPAHTTMAAPSGGIDAELSGAQATDEVARVDLAEQVPLSSHASGGGTGTEDTTSDRDYAPAYSRRSRGQEPEIVSDTGSIESLLGATARDVSSAETTAFPAVDDETDVTATNPQHDFSAPQPFWILAPTERDVHDERGDSIFRVGPSAWALVIEDRGGAYVIRHDDGRIGYLHDIADITRG